MIGGIEARAEVDRRAAARTRVHKVDLLARRPVHRELRDAARRAELRDVPELPAADPPITGADLIVDVAELYEAVQPCVHAEAGLDGAADERAGPIDLMIGVQERPQPGDRTRR